MKRATILRQLRPLLLAIAACASGGCYNPSPGNGQILCSTDGRCPAGFTCAIDHTCWRDGQLPPIDFSGTGGEGGSSPDLADGGATD